MGNNKGKSTEEELKELEYDRLKDNNHVHTSKQVGSAEKKDKK